MSYGVGEEQTYTQEGYGDYDYSYQEGGDGGEGNYDYSDQTNGGEYYPEYDENGGYYDENGNYVDPNNYNYDYNNYDGSEGGEAPYYEGGEEGGDYQQTNDYTPETFESQESSQASHYSAPSSTISSVESLPRSASHLALSNLVNEISSATTSPSGSFYLSSTAPPPEAVTAKFKPSPPRLRNGEIPPYYDDEETGYQYYLDDDGNTQWDLSGYYEPDGEYVYYEDVETEMNTRAFEEELEAYQHQYNDDEKADKETEEERKVRHRAAVDKEIIETEKSYVESLDILVKKYMGPLVASGVLDKDERTTIFSNIPSLFSINNALLRDLLLLDETTHLTPGGKSFADIWLATVEYFKMYSVYCTNYPTALKFTQTLQKQKPQFHNFCREMKNATSSKLDLTDFLIKPVQRICKYPLLFRELIKNTDTDHKEYSKLLEVEKRLQQVAGHVNEAKRMAESLQTVVEIASLLTDLPPSFTLVEANRRFLFRGTYSAQTNGKAPKSSELLLFSDVVIQVRPRMLSKQLKFVAMLWIRSIIVRDPGDTRLELEDEGVCLLIDFKEALEKEKWRSEIVNTKQQAQEDEINKALKARPKRRQRPGELQREQSMFINKDNLNDGRSISPRSDEDHGVDGDGDGDGDGEGEGQGSSIHSYDTVHRLIEKEEERKREVDRRLSELDTREKEYRERLLAVRTRNGDLEREIADLQAKVYVLEAGTSNGGGYSLSGSGGHLLSGSGGGSGGGGYSATTDDLGSRPSRGSAVGSAPSYATMRKPAPGEPNNFGQSRAGPVPPFRRDSALNT